MWTALIPSGANGQPTPAIDESSPIVGRDSTLRDAPTAHAIGIGAAGAAADSGDGLWLGLDPPARYRHAAVFDSLRNRLVVIGGTVGPGVSGPALSDVWALSLDGTPQWSPLVVTGTGPSARSGHTAILDPMRDRIVIFGGYDTAGNLLNDVWALSLNETSTWSAVTPSGNQPTGRLQHSAVYDPSQDRMIVFGGATAIGQVNDVWSLSLSGTPGWTQVTPAGTPPRVRDGHSAIYDPKGNRMVVFAGESLGAPALNDVWALSLGDTIAWSQLTPIGPVPPTRVGHCAAFDPAGQQMIVFSGYSFFGYSGWYPVNDTWALSLSDSIVWSQLLPASSPDARYDARAAYDTRRNRVLVSFGRSSVAFSDAWSLTLADTTWAPLMSGFVPVAARAALGSTYDPVRQRMLVFGGRNPYYLNDTWALSLCGPPIWSPVTASGASPPPRNFANAIFDPVRDRMIVFGGYSSNVYNDVWALSLSGTPAWTQLFPTGTFLLPRWGSSAIYDPVGDRMIIFGGVIADALGYNATNDVWALSLAGTLAWTKLNPSGVLPAARYGQTAIYDPTRRQMVIFGGYWSGGNDVWSLTLGDSVAWTQWTPSGALPGVRYTHGAIYDPVRDRMVIFGGSGAQLYGDAWALSLANDSPWHQLVPNGTSPTPRYGPGAIYDQVHDRLVIFGGGVSASSYLNDTWALWFAGNLTGVPVQAPGRGAFLPAPVPNPVTSATRLGFSLPRAGNVRLEVFDSGGRRIRRILDGRREAGPSTVVWNGTGDSGAPVPAGVYFIRLTAPGVRESRTLVILR